MTARSKRIGTIVVIAAEDVEVVAVGSEVAVGFKVTPGLCNPV